LFPDWIYLVNFSAFNLFISYTYYLFLNIVTKTALIYSCTCLLWNFLSTWPGLKTAFQLFFNTYY